MPFDIRCPDCRAKLRLDEKPGRDDPIECPKCGSTFTPADSAAAAKAAGKTAAPTAKEPKKGKRPEEAKAGAPTGDKAPMEAKERTFFNPFALLAIIAVCLLAYVAFCSFVLNMLGKSGKVEDMVAFVPKECNTARGANLQILNRYPGYKSELDKYATPPVRAALDELAKAGGLPPDAFLDYMVYGKQRERAVGMTMYVFRCMHDVDPAAVKVGLKARDEATRAGGTPGLRMPPDAPGVLANALVDFPTRRHVVIVPAAGNADQAQTFALCRGVAADRSKSFVDLLNDTGRVVIRGHGWLLLRVAGANESIPAGLTEPLKKDIPAFSEKIKTTKMLGVWNSFGASVRFGGAIECESASAASTLAKSVREGPMGQGDDAEIPRGLKSVFYVANNKEFRAMMSNFSFRTNGTCAYYTSSLSGEAAKQMLMYINLPAMIDGGSGGP